MERVARKLALLAAATAMVVVTAAGSAQAITLLDGMYTFDDDAFADEIGTVYGDFETNPGTYSLEDAILGSDLESYATATGGGVAEGEDPFIEVKFTDNWVVNEEGVDLVLFEIGASDSFSVTIEVLYGTDIVEVETRSTGKVLDNGKFVNVAEIDMDLFGAPLSFPDWEVSDFTIGFRVKPSQYFGPNSYASLAAVGALHSKPQESTETGAVPEPATLILLGSGLAGVARWRRRSGGPESP